MAKVDTFLKNGGTILFDTRDAGGFTPLSGGSQTPENRKLREILAFVDVPPLEPVPPDHVLTKAFYLLSGFPGRWNNSELWVETIEDTTPDPNRPARGGDGVSPISSPAMISVPPGPSMMRAYTSIRRCGGSPPARDGLQSRCEHRNVYADRQLQGRPGARAGPS
jgi:hypothetical protein